MSQNLFCEEGSARLVSSIRERCMTKLIYLMIIVGAGIAALGAEELMVYGWDTRATFEVSGGAVVIVGALALSGLTRWR